MDNNHDGVVIIGAGICGLATALALHKKGIKAVVMEKSESLRNVTGAAITIRPNGWRALHQLGVADILRQTAIPIHWERIISLDGGRKKEISLTPWDGESRCLRRKDLINTLYAALPRGTVKFDCQLESIKLDPRSNKPVLLFVNGNSIIPKLVIGCDGGKSIIADFLNLKPTKTFPLCSIRGLTNYPSGHSYGHEFTRFMKDNVLVGIIPIDENLIYWFCATSYNPGADKKAWEDPEVIRQSSLEFVREHPQEIRQMIENADAKSLSLTNLRYRAPWELLTSTFCKGTVMVAGDAMHVMGPFLAQGGSAGLEDAVVLARIMAQQGLKSPESGNKMTVQGVQEAFYRFVKERRMRVVRLSFQTYLTGMIVSASSRIKKIIYIILLILLFHNKSGHIDYDCGDL